ncbi:MAG: hypothetical protein GXP33_12705 [Spirochaetes bacterium]|nr:hypothetical protein [Spirochaetota bacterium]
MQLNNNTDRSGCQEKIKKKFSFYEEFWKKNGPFPILFSEPHIAKSKNYIKYNLVEQHNDVHKLFEDSLLAIEPYLSLADDGIPAIRPDLGTTLLPGSLNLPIKVQPNQHPWLKKHMSLEEYVSLPDNFSLQRLRNGEVKTAEEFYKLFLAGKKRRTISPYIFPYVPDTQGIFDLTHLIIGENIFFSLYDKPELVQSAQVKSLDLFLSATRLFKRLIGVRTFVLPYIKKAIKPFGRCFFHFCGRHEDFLQMICNMNEVSALNLGNPEAYDLEYLFHLLGKTHTVYFGHLPLLYGESAETYLERLAGYCKRFKARLILVADYHPGSDTEKICLVNIWHRLTGKIL